MAANGLLDTIGETHTARNIRSASLQNKKTDLKHPASKNWLIHLHYIRREFETCKSIIFEELQRTNGNSEYANYVLSLIYRSEGKMQESLDKLQARVSQEAFEALAQIALAKKNLHDAIIVYEKAARIFPENSELLSNLGLLYMKVGRDDVSFVRLGSALAFDPLNSKALVAMASMMQTHEDYDHALAKYKGAMQTLPDSASVWNNTGMCFHFGKRKYVAAMSCLKRAYYLSPFDWKILHNLGLIHLHMQQYASAFHFLTASINLKPLQSHNFFLLAELFTIVAISHLDDLDYATHAFEQALRLNSEVINTDPATLWLNYGISLFNHKKYAEAYQKFKQVHAILSKTPRGSIDPDVKSTFTRVKSAMKLMNFHLQEENEPEILSAPPPFDNTVAPNTDVPTSTKLRDMEKTTANKKSMNLIDEADLV
ncbi:Bardet-Biedl syndrome 4 protein [Folsomia candida]|uniref:Bardet-Biedl syndrome 4 protein n=1 Tax=Folsomia candida TaxID=158441 RepID=A0A226E390_FOLCA|nr:Bardet-Biedl syndrome 4 protein [Folsomia candida]